MLNYIFSTSLLAGFWFINAITYGQSFDWKVAASWVGLQLLNVVMHGLLMECGPIWYIEQAARFDAKSILKRKD